jgi:hypothetical protein
MLQSRGGSYVTPRSLGRPVRVVRDRGFTSRYRVVRQDLEELTTCAKLGPWHSPEEPRVGLLLHDPRRDSSCVFGIATKIKFDSPDQIGALPSGRVPVCVVHLEASPHHASSHT